MWLIPKEEKLATSSEGSPYTGCLKLSSGSNEEEGVAAKAFLCEYSDISKEALKSAILLGKSRVGASGKLIARLKCVDAEAFISWLPASRLVSEKVRLLPAARESE